MPAFAATSIISALSKALQGLLTMLRDGGHAGLVLVLDEVETLQRVRGDVREKALNALRQLLDELPLYPGLYLMITGTPAFFDGPQGVRRLTPLAQRLHTDFGTDPRFDNPRAPQIRLRGFDLDSAGGSRPQGAGHLCRRLRRPRPDRVAVRRLLRSDSRGRGVRQPGRKGRCRARGCS